MENTPGALIAMSGGVDSSVAAYLMKQAGYRCMGATMRLYQNEDLGQCSFHTCCSAKDVEDAADVAFQLDIPFEVINYTDEFREKVIKKFIATYETGGTPNPCIDCNRYMKFDKMLAFARELPDYIQLTEDRDEVFRCADYVSLHVPATKDTVHSVSDHEFDLMKESAFLINTARGKIVDEGALIRALEAKKIAGAGLDVVEQEPFDLKNPLLKMENVLVAPHIGGATREASTRSSLACAQAIDDFFSGRRPKFIVPELRDLME